MSRPIDYQSRFVPPNEYEHAYEQERGRWLRRRLIWYSGTSLAFGLLLSLPALAIRDSGVSWTDITTLLISNAGAAAVMILAWRCRPQPQLVLRIAFLFYVLASLWTIGYSYFAFTQQGSAFQVGLSEGYDSGRNAATAALEEDSEDAPESAVSTATTVPASRPVSIEGDLDRLDEPLKIRIGSSVLKPNAAQMQDYLLHGVLYSGLLFSFFINHLIVCLFIPWTVRESLRPAGIIAGAAIAMAAIHVLLGLSAWWILLIMMCAVPFTFVPGTLICWWRYSRFNKRFQLQFESGRYRALQHELDSARQVHDANLPEPRLSGPVRMNYLYEPMRQIGGDLLMVYPPDKSVPIKYAILFDVTGHGVAAALSVNRIVGEIERLLAENPDESAEQLTRALNRYVHLTLARHHLYVSAILLRIDHERNEIECVNAGHPTAYHIDCRSRTTKPIDSNAMLLGVLSASDFFVEPTRIPFAVGDAIIGYTDGASEATDPDGRMLGLKGVRDAVGQTINHSSDPADWPLFLSRYVIEHRLAPSQDDTIIFSLWRT